MARFAKKGSQGSEKLAQVEEKEPDFQKRGARLAKKGSQG